jgi:hypothetical protein
MTGPKGDWAMKLTKKVGVILLSVWLILMGLISALKLTFHYDYIVVGALAIAAGIFLLLDQ